MTRNDKRCLVKVTRVESASWYQRYYWALWVTNRDTVSAFPSRKAEEGYALTTWGARRKGARAASRIRREVKHRNSTREYLV